MLTWAKLGAGIVALVNWVLQFLHDQGIREDERRRRKEQEDEALERINNVDAGGLPDDPRDYRD